MMRECAVVVGDTQDHSGRGSGGKCCHEFEGHVLVAATHVFLATRLPFIAGLRHVGCFALVVGLGPEVTCACRVCLCSIVEGSLLGLEELAAGLPVLIFSTDSRL